MKSHGFASTAQSQQWLQPGLSGNKYIHNRCDEWNQRRESRYNIATIVDYIIPEDATVGGWGSTPKALQSGQSSVTSNAKFLQLSSSSSVA